jgi:TonB family protein
MTSLSSWLFGYLLNSLWQAPVLLAVAWCAARLLRPLGPLAEHRIWVAALLLEVALPALAADPAALLSELWASLSRFTSTAADAAQVIATTGTVTALHPFTLPPAILQMIAVAYALLATAFFIRLGWRLLATRKLLRRAQPTALSSAAAQTWHNLCETAHTPTLLAASPAKLASTHIAISPEVSSPVTVGIRRFFLLLPATFLAETAPSDFTAVFAHELAHMRRHDFAKNLAYEALSLPIAFHPAVWLTRARLAESREMVCDLLAAGAEGNASYARSLLRLATLLTRPRPAGTLHAIGIFDANTLERRIMNLTQPAQKVTLTRRILTVSACGALALVTCASALALRVNVAGPAAAEATERLEAQSDAIKVAGGVMAGQILEKKQPVYPGEAKANPVNGSVILHAIIGKDGTIENLTILKSLREDYDASALDAVKDWKYQPYLLNGEPVEVETTITVNFWASNELPR